MWGTPSSSGSRRPASRPSSAHWWTGSRSSTGRCSDSPAVVSPDYDVLVYSVLTDYTQGLYRHRELGLGRALAPVPP